MRFTKGIPSLKSARPISAMLGLLLSALTVTAQTTTFSYQGKLADTGTPVSGSYDFQFKLLDALTGGAAVGSASVNGVTVTNGAFTLNLDFGVCADCFNGADRFLEISVKPTSGSTFTTLSPRQQITSAPYAIKSRIAATADGLSVACLNCVTSAQIQSVLGSQVSGAIPVASVPAGSGNYIQNGTVPQPAANFNITGDGSASGTLSAKTVNATTEYDMGGSRVIGTLGVDSIYVGLNAGGVNTGMNNAFFGSYAGRNNTSGVTNSFFGHQAGTNNTIGSNNSFFGVNAGASNVGASGNAFFGASAGLANTAVGNSFFGAFAGQSTTTGFSNAFFGYQAGQLNTTGSNNSFFGSAAGLNNTGSNNAFFGGGAGYSNSTGVRNSFFGASAGLNNNACCNSFFGYFAGNANLSGRDNSFFGDSSGAANTGGSENTFVGAHSGSHNTGGNHNVFVGYGAGEYNTTGNFNTFFGSLAGNSNVDGIDNAYFGTGAGASSLGGANSFFGYNAGVTNTVGNNNSFFGEFAGLSNTVGGQNTFMGVSAGQTNEDGHNNTGVGHGADVGVKNLQYATAIGSLAVVSSSNTIALGRSAGLDTVRIPGKLVIETLSAATATHLCINASSEVSSCSSSLRYKSNVLPLEAGLGLLRRLRPVTFRWTGTGETDLGLIAEEVNTVEPLLVTRDKTGEIQGVKYDQLGVVLINAIKEQQSQIEQQQTRMETQQTQIDSLLKIVCLDHPGADLCKPKSNQ